MGNLNWRSLHLGFLVLIFFSQASSGEVFKSTQNILDFALERHPTAQISKIDVERASKEEDLASQIPNPDFSSYTLFGDESGGMYSVGNANFLTELNLAHTFELGGKRAARINIAQANLNLSKAFQVQSREEVYLNTLITLYRLRQIKEEIEVIDNALKIFVRFVRLYRLRPKLTPEQRGTLRIFEVAEADYKMRRAPLETETGFRLKELELALGYKYIPSPSLLPRKRKSWPPSLPGTDKSEIGGYRQRQAKASVEISEAKLDQAKSAAWPDLKIGPSILYLSNSDQSVTALGFNLSLPLPIYHRNEGGKAFSKAGLNVAEYALLKTKKENEYQRAHFRTKYENSVRVLMKAPPSGRLSKKRKEIETLFNQGLLSGRVVVEIHRQISDFVKTQNEQELSAIIALIRYHALDGKLIGIP